MFEDFKTHSLHYLVLLTVIAIGFGSVFILSSDRNTQIFLGGLTALLYVFWGIIHHYMEDDLNIKIVVEYSLIAILSVVILFSLLIRR